MSEDFESMSTAELVDNLATQGRKQRSNSVGEVLYQLIQRASAALQELQCCQEDEDNGYAVSGELLAQLSLLYDDRLCSQLVQLLSSAALGPRNLAGVTYLLALLTAGGSNHAVWLRSKMLKGPGVLRLVALLSDESVSVRFNSLLVLDNFLRHCPCVHPEIVRLGVVRKLSKLFNQACEEPQQNLCVQAFLYLCDSGSPDTCQELFQSGSAAFLLQWLQGNGTSARVVIKALKSINVMLEKSAVRSNGIFQLHLVEPLLSVLQTQKFQEIEELQRAAWKTLECACCNEEDDTHRSHFLVHGGVNLLVKTVVSSKQRDVIVQVIGMLAMLASLDFKIRQEVVSNGSCLQFLQDLLIANSECPSTSSILVQNTTSTEFAELLPLSNEDVSTVSLLLQVCNMNGQSGKRVGNCAPMFAVETWRVAARVGAD